MLYNLKTQKYVEEAIVLGIYHRQRRNGLPGGKMPFVQYRETLLAANGGHYLESEIKDTRCDVLIREYASEIGVRVRGRVRYIQRAKDESMVLCEDRAGSKFWVNRRTGEVHAISLCADNCY